MASPPKALRLETLTKPHQNEHVADHSTGQLLSKEGRAGNCPAFVRGTHGPARDAGRRGYIPGNAPAFAK